MSAPFCLHELPSSRPPGSAAPGQCLLHQLLQTSLIRPTDWASLPGPVQEELQRHEHESALLAQLVEHKLLTQYQADRIEAGKSYGLTIGNYRVLGRLGAGAMGVVFKAEHLRLPRQVAIKVVPALVDLDPLLLQRFHNEMWAVARLQHPNIVAALDAGEMAGPDATSPTLHYLVMEYVPGMDLEAQVEANGPLDFTLACDLAYQVASALAEAHRQNLVHRDVKPSNVLVTPEGQAKLLDFGLTRQLGFRLTQPGTVLGTLDYMAPEQIQDASNVDIRSDLYGLGGTLFWCLTGRSPFASRGNVAEDMAHRLTHPPPPLRTWRPDAPAELEAVVARLLAPDPDDRYATPQAVMQALLLFIKPQSRDGHILAHGPACGRAASWKQDAADDLTAEGHRVLVVDDEPAARRLCRHVLEAEGLHCEEADCGAAALVEAHARRYDLLLLDINMPDLKGTEVLRRLRENPPGSYLRIIMVSGHAASDEMAELMMAGADDYLGKPFSSGQLRARVKAALRLKDAQERAAALNRNMLFANQELENNLHASHSDLIHARNALVLALAELVGYRDAESGNHLVRLQRYCRCLAEEAAGLSTYAGQIDDNFIHMLEACAPLHDIGKVGLPDHILQKSDKLAIDERIIMQTHTTIGADVLHKVARQHGFARAFLHMAADIARHHHERYDGQGYPDRLAGEDIPLAARLVTIADVYDALRSRRPYKPALPHGAAIQVMVEACPGQFDPALLQVFQRCSHHFDSYFRELSD
jgi:response regulator RpfG family c-di-GMP phosphodiesterase